MLPQLQAQKKADGLMLDISDLQSLHSNGEAGEDEEEKRVLLACEVALSPSLKLSRDSQGHPIVLGGGAHGCVYELTGSRTSRTKMKRALKITQYTQERDILLTFNSVNIVKCFHVTQINSHNAIVMEYCPVNLQQLLHFCSCQTNNSQQVALPDDALRQVANHVANAIHYVHGKGWIHLDIKPENILFDKFSNPKLADFSSARRWQVGMWYEGRDAFPVGTGGYMAPEIVLEKGYNHSADWFSLGVVLLEAALGRLPWSKDDLSMLNKLAEGQFAFHGLHPHLQHLLCGLLRLKHKNRLGSRGIREIKATKYFSEIRNDGCATNLQFSLQVLGHHTDVVMTEFENLFFLIFTQYEKIGTLVSVERDVSLNDREGPATFSTKVLLGADEEVTHVIARRLAEKLASTKPVLMSLALRERDLSPLPHLEDVIEILKS